MSTRSEIIRENADGSFDAIYCHFDGYPENNGRILFEHYQDKSKVDALIALGDLSSLGVEIGEAHDFDKSPDGVCNAYGRDRHEKNVETSHFVDVTALSEMLKDSWTEWIYVFRPDGKWYYTNNPSPTWFKLCGTAQRETEELTPAAWDRRRRPHNPRNAPSPPRPAASLRRTKS